jgi:hypothetical protein
MTNFQPVKTSDEQPSVFTNCGKADRAARKEKRPRPERKITRVPFTVSRLMEFSTRRELQNQTGHSVDDWPLVALKEGMDNALDACEEAEIAPVIEVNVSSGSIAIQDNAAGIDTNTIKLILDYTIRVSSREAYVSPTRGLRVMLSRLFSLWGTCSTARNSATKLMRSG